jgi:hypothetical protein
MIGSSMLPRNLAPAWVESTSIRSMVPCVASISLIVP